jgi:hypothetical protein
MTSRPYNLLSRVRGVVAPTLVARRLRTSRHRNPAAWRAVGWKNGQLQTLETAFVAARTSAPTVRRSHLDAEERLASIWRCADLGETMEPLAVPAVRRGQESNSRWRVRGIATWVSYAVRLTTFNLAVAIIHLAVLRWIFLPIGG